MTNLEPINRYALRTNAWKKEEENLLLGLIAELGVTKGSKKAVEILPRTYYACFAKACKLKKSIINKDKVYILVGSMWMLANYDPQSGQYYSLLSTGNPFYYKDVKEVRENWNISQVNYPPTAKPMGWASGVNTPTNVGSSS